MFPLLDRAAGNPLELFQIWLNLPRADKMVAPYFTMLWSGDIPRLSFTDEDGRAGEVTVIAGALGGRAAPPPPPNSWAAHPEAEVAIWSLRLSPGARWTLPAATRPGLNRTLYFFRGPSLRVAGESVPGGRGVTLRPEVAVPLEAGDGECEALLLQGRPIDEPVAQYGPFVMNTNAELQQAFTDYRRTGFGGWPWPGDDPVHGRDPARFARHADGRVERHGE